MITKTFFLSLFIGCIILSFYSCGSCSKKIDCPGYKDDVLDSWFAYSNNQQLIFLSNTNQRDTFTLRNIMTTAPYQYTRGPFSPPLSCSAEKIFETVEIDSLKQTKLRVELSSSNGNRGV